MCWHEGWGWGLGCRAAEEGKSVEAYLCVGVVVERWGERSSCMLRVAGAHLERFGMRWHNLACSTQPPAAGRRQCCPHNHVLLSHPCHPACWRGRKNAAHIFLVLLYGWLEGFDAPRSPLNRLVAGMGPLLPSSMHGSTLLVDLS